MKKLVFSMALLSVFCLKGFAQENIIPKPAKVKSTKADALVINLYTDLWQKTPDSIKVRTVNQGISISGMYNISMGAHFGFAFGLGISAHNFYSDGMLGLDSVRKSEFTPLPSTVNGRSISYNINKLSITYLDIPVEFRFAAAKFRMALGFKFGFTLDSHTKYRGTDYSTGDGSLFVKDKKLSNIDNASYALTARIGYKWAILNASYYLGGIFKKDKGPEIFPISIGLTAIPF